MRIHQKKNPQHELVIHTNIEKNSLKKWEWGLIACNPPSFYKREAFMRKNADLVHFMSKLPNFHGKLHG